MPVGPASRYTCPVEGQSFDGVKSEKNGFCMRRQTDAGMMLEVRSPTQCQMAMKGLWEDEAIQKCRKQCHGWKGR